VPFDGEAKVKLTSKEEVIEYLSSVAKLTCNCLCHPSPKLFCKTYLYKNKQTEHFVAVQQKKMTLFTLFLWCLFWCFVIVYMLTLILC